jgi:hypothetical protein
VFKSLSPELLEDLLDLKASEHFAGQFGMPDSRPTAGVCMCCSTQGGGCY